LRYKRLERGRFVWPLTREGAAILTPAQLSMLCEGIDWRVPLRTGALDDAPRRAG
jgi:transposase